MKLIYEVSDGYAGPSAPHSVTINDDEIRECETTQDAMRMIAEIVQEHFLQNVYPSYDEAAVRAKVDIIRTIR